MAEPAAKRSRRLSELEDDYIRTIELDLRNYGESAKWLRGLSPKELLMIFEIGLKIRESTMLTVDVSQSFLKKELSSQMQPVKSTLESIEKEVKNQLREMQENVGRDVAEKVKQMSTDVEAFKGDLRKDIGTIQRELVSRVNTVVENVPPLNKVTECVEKSERKLNETIHRDIKPVIDNCKMQLVEMSTSLKRSSHIIGSVGQKLVINLLREQFGNFHVRDISKEPRKGDILMESPRQHKFMIEVKNRESSNVPQSEIDRFKSNLASSPDVRVGVLLSMKSGIANKVSHGKFQIIFNENQYQIYVPNAGEDEAMITWSVLMADELAQSMQGDLGTSQIQKLEELYKEFQETKDHEKTCRDNLDSLERAAKNLRESMNFILNGIDKTRKKMKRLIDSDAPVVGKNIATVQLD
ncbi:unnamed protein product [Porites evermanni]|uniref:Uncharacterized protein n=1 Tax=Porites evermanni TaxID=104178 RepID=A0ABN8LFM7_9CNID|nr:unnamed protein product [Porites evermanni]